MYEQCKVDYNETLGHEQQNNVSTWQGLDEEGYISAIVLNKSLRVTHNMLQARQKMV